MLEETPRVTAYGYEIRCRMLTFEDDVLGVGLKFSENHKTGEMTIDFASAFLPPNRLNPQVTQFKDRPDIARVVVAVIDTYMLRQQDTKSTAQTAVSIGHSIIRTLEYFWLQDIYHLKYVTPGHWANLLEKFASGGWYLALDLEHRASVIDMRTLNLTRRKQKEGIEYSCNSLLAAIGANIGTGQVRLEYRRGDARGQLLRTRADPMPGPASLMALVSNLNNLVELPKEMRATCVAHPSPAAFAESAAAARNRTENFEPAHLASLMAEAYRWVSIYSDPIIKLVEKVYSDLSAYELEDVVEARLLRLLEAPEKRVVENLLGVRVVTVARLGDWDLGMGLLGLIRTLLAACFLLLGVFNGRRKDEVASKATGLYAEGFECVDEVLSLYQSYFYCEKTICDYRQFYVNEISFKALTTAKAISDIAWSVVARNGGQPQTGQLRKLFCMPPRGREQSPAWYDYSTDSGIENLCKRATGATIIISPNSHMFRRAYAVVFTYRYENADLYALSQQLAHRDLAMSLHYVFEGPSRVLAHHAAKLWGDGGESKKARAAQAAELAAEVKAYGRVKLHDDVLEILRGGASVAGGFPRLVQRFARKLLGRISYDDASLKQAAKTVSSTLIDRGHAVIPFPHGNCNAGSPKPGARCFHEGQLAREFASPKVCGTCPYHLMKETHQIAIEDDLLRQREYLSHRSASLQTNAELKALEATEQLVAFYRKKAKLSENE